MLASGIAPDLDDVVRFNCKHAPRLQLARDEGKESRARTEIEDDGTRSNSPAQGSHVRGYTRFVGDHVAVRRDVIHARPAPKNVKRACWNLSVQRTREWLGTTHLVGPDPNVV